MIRLLQFSDTHLFADPGHVSYGVRPDATLQAVLKEARRRERGYAAALVSGDLVHDEGAAYGRLRKHFAALGVPVHCLPGNHDLPAEMRVVLAMPPVSWQRSAQYGKWRLIFLDSTVPGEVGGHLGEDELTVLDQLLADAGADYAVVCLHHPPRPCGCAWLDRRLNLDNPQALFSVLDAHDKVRAVLWGHIHQAFDEWRKGVRLLGTPSTMVQFRPDSPVFALDEGASPGYRWLNLGDDGMVETGVVRVVMSEQD